MRDLVERLRTRLHARFSTVSEAQMSRAFRRARADLRTVGLLDDGRYLDRIRCAQSSIPTFKDEYGFVYDRGVPPHEALVGYEVGVIYLPLNPPVDAYIPGGTLVDTMRHEFGHAWAWLDARYIDRRWFREAFGYRYDDEWHGGVEPDFDAAHFVSDYACKAPKEDFAETFMVFLRCHRSLDRFRARRGVHRKLKAVERAVAVAARDRVYRVRGPR